MQQRRLFHRGPAMRRRCSDVCASACPGWHAAATTQTEPARAGHYTGYGFPAAGDCELRQRWPGGSPYPGRTTPAGDPEANTSNKRFGFSTLPIHSPFAAGPSGVCRIAIACSQAYLADNPNGGRICCVPLVSIVLYCATTVLLLQVHPPTKPG